MRSRLITGIVFLIILLTYAFAFAAYIPAPFDKGKYYYQYFYDQGTPATSRALYFNCRHSTEFLIRMTGIATVEIQTAQEDKNSSWGRLYVVDQTDLVGGQIRLYFRGYTKFMRIKIISITSGIVTVTAAGQAL